MIPLWDNALSLEETYINLRVAKEETSSKATHLTEQVRQSSGIEAGFVKAKEIVEKNTSSQPILVEKLLEYILKHENISKRHMVFLGSSGSGKTTVLRYLAYSIASGREKEWGLKGFIPIFINLDFYARSGERSLLQYALSEAVVDINDDIEREGIKEALRQYIDECEENSQVAGRIIFLLDGLDEVTIEKRKVVKEIERMRNLYKKAFFIVTCRNINYYEMPLNAFGRYCIRRNF